MFLGVPAQEWLALGIKVTIVSLVSYCASSYMLDLMQGRDKKSRAAARRILKSVGVSEDIELDQYEIDIALQVVNPESIPISWNDIGGQEEIIKVMKTDVISLIKNPSIMKSSNYYRPPKGILLYGPPGVGKTMIAQAAAKESNARFINLNISSLTSKWYGESVKLARAVFTLAEKISPCIIFIDELDTFLRSRSLNDHEATTMMKAQFLSLWDGFAVDAKNRIVVMGATNRKFNIDDAILSRMELQFEIKLPNYNQRKEIFKKMLKSVNIDDKLSIDELASLTDSFSGRDIDDICREASMKCLREYLLDEERIVFQSSNDSAINKNMKDESNKIRKVNKNDFIAAIHLKKRNFNRIID